MAVENYGLTFVKGMFGTAKTYSTFLNYFLEDLKKGDSKPFIFANVPYSVVDCFYSTTDDLKSVFELLVEYCIRTNIDIENYFNQKSSLRDIVLIVDEAHRYFDAREFQKLLSDYKTVITQCRKRNIKIILITQKLTSCDIIFRRLADYTKEYKKGRIGFGTFTLFEWVSWSEYENPGGDLGDLETDTKINVLNSDAYQPNKNLKVDSGLFTPMTSILQLKDILFNKAYKLADQERFNSYYISGFEDPRVKIPNLQEFQELLIIPKTKKDIQKEKDLQEQEKKSLIKRPYLNIINYKNDIINFINGNTKKDLQKQQFNETITELKKQNY